MKISASILLVLTSASTVGADTKVVRRAYFRYPSLTPTATKNNDATITSLLMEKAVPVKDYQSQFGSANVVPYFMIDRQLEDNNNDDDYYSVNFNHDFSSYSLKYTTCQKVQRFSSSAIEDGEFSPLVTNDVVILRLCPTRRCSDDAELGCSVGFGEYVLDLEEYLKIMMQYETDKKRNLCGLCKACANGYGDYYYSGYKYGQRERTLEDAGDGDDAAAATDDDYAEGTVCASHSGMCYNYENWCVFGEEDRDEGDNEEDGYASYNDYMEYLGCVEVDDDVYVNARCDPDSGQISMAVFYDSYCSQYAGDKVNVNAVVDAKFQTDAFEALYSGDCIACESSTSPPYYNAHNNMCNKMYQKTGKCNSYIAYDFGNNVEGADEGTGTTCAFIESIRDRLYDEAGQFNMNSNGAGTVTTTQIALLAVIGVLCFCLALYSCYIHHEITNLLLKSIAQKNLMDEVARETARDREPSREEQKRRKNSRGGSRSSVLGRLRRKKDKVAPSDDGVEADRSWDGD